MTNTSEDPKEVKETERRANLIADCSSSDIFGPPYNREVLVNTLVYHQHREDSSCICGWAELGRSHPEHVADVYESRWKERD